MQQEINPSNILQLGLGFWGAKTLLTAVELGLFTELANNPMEAKKLAERLGIQERGSRDFFDALVALKMLSRDGACYQNSPETDLFLDRNKPSYVGGILEMSNLRLYPFWGSLTEALRTGKPQNEAKNGDDLFQKLYSDPERLESFLRAMTGISLPAARVIAQQFPWDNYNTFADVGCAQGALPVQIALRHGHVQATGYDLPPVQPIFERYVRSHGLGERIRFAPGNFFKDPLPQVDVLVMGHILHDWNLEEKMMLLTKAYDALSPGGSLIVYDAVIDDERKENAFGLLMSLNMLIETSGGFDYTGADACAWMRETGFRETRVEHLTGPDSMIVGIK
jgi:SAM-dependent methyltransferase